MALLVIHNQDGKILDCNRNLKRHNYPFTDVNNVQDSMTFLANNHPETHAIIIDFNHILKEPDFLKTLATKDHLQDIPLILILDDIRSKEIKRFKHISPYQWLQRPFTPHTLHAMIHGAQSESRQRRQLRNQIHSRESVIGTITSGTFCIKTFEEAEALTTMLSLACPEPDRIAFGLFELLANAIEHGNLEISHKKKWCLMKKDTHRQEIERRLSMPKYKNRYVTIKFEQEGNLVSFKIEDQGRGFNFNDYLHIDLSANQTHHGRGIALARATSFDYLEYIGNGNKVLAITKFETA
ncbi:MAG: ATP-binding protein [Emcibacter sp.]|nr:ATP-binding protein [Emcibacter sp.]